MLKAKLLGATAAAVESTYIEDVFSTYLYTGNGSTQTITNGIDLAGEGGLVWIKSRSAATDNFLFDTTRGATKEINSNSTAAEATLANSLTAFNADGFSIGSATGIGVNAATYASWTFRQAPRFFDVVTWTGTGANRTIAHDLGVVPGCIIVKRTDTTGNWQVYHRSIANTEYMVLNSTAAKATGATRWNSTTPTSSVFSLGTDATVNASGSTYVAYLYAHDPLGPSGDGSDGLIACGSYTGNGSNTAGPFINLGWEPQWILVKSSSASWDWMIVDNMRGMPAYDAFSNTLRPNTAVVESESHRFNPSATGFRVNDDNALVNANGDTYIYIAIRRGPMREPTVGTQVFQPSYGLNASNSEIVNAGFPIDLNWRENVTGGFNVFLQDRMRGFDNFLSSNTTSAESGAGGSYSGTQNGILLSATLNFSDWINWSFRRAPGFFDVVAYTGTGANRTISHNLGAVPELMIVKKRSAADNWVVYAGDATDYLILNSTAATADLNTMWNDTSPTSSVFSLGTNDDVNGNTATFIAYLFASLPGISKVGSSTGNGSSQTINCAFTTGARFILIKRTDSTGDWYVWDTARGIVSGNDPHLSLNTTDAEVTSDDTIDPDSTGFIVNQVAATNVNVNAASYIYLAIA